MTDYSELVKALRCKRDDCEGCDLSFFDKDEGWMCRYAAKDDDAADAIEALQAELAGSKDAIRILKHNLEMKMPKRGEWINSKERMRPDMCSVCGCIYEADRFMDKIAWNYCPNCGADMRKMEVQE